MKKTEFVRDWIYNGQPVTLPHDAMIHENRKPDAPGSSGHAYFPGGVYTYEKKFDVTAEQVGKPMLLHFEGVYRNSVVTVNGLEAGGCTYGYIPFTVELTKLVHAGENTVSVRVDNSQLPNSRWYSGSGIYRPVWLVTAEEDHIAFEGVKVDTVSIDPAKSVCGPRSWAAVILPSKSRTPRTEPWRKVKEPMRRWRSAMESFGARKRPISIPPM